MTTFAAKIPHSHKNSLIYSKDGLTNAQRSLN